MRGEAGRQIVHRQRQPSLADARVFANLANVLLPVGALSFAAGSILFWRGSKRAPKRTETALRVVPMLGGAAAMGEF